MSGTVRLMEVVRPRRAGTASPSSSSSILSLMRRGEKQMRGESTLTWNIIEEVVVSRVKHHWDSFCPDLR